MHTSTRTFGLNEMGSRYLKSGSRAVEIGGTIKERGIETNIHI